MRAGSRDRARLNTMRHTLFHEQMPAAIEHFRDRDPILAGLVERMPPLEIAVEEDRFLALVNAIVNQQLSGRAAGSIMRRLEALFPGGITWMAIGAVATERLRESGLSRAKAASLQDLAAHVAAGAIDLEGLDQLNDEDVIAELIRVRGIGRWTAEMFLLFSLQRPDVLPVTDLGFRSALRRHYALDSLPNRAEAEAIGAPWRPFSSIATLFLWRSLD